MASASTPTNPTQTVSDISETNLQTRLVVGMEIHVELATRTKMFTSAANVAHRDYYDASPNSLCDPVVLGMPGVLPVINKQAVEMAMLVGLALGCQIARQTKWDRKSYYYPDLPKSYQISQYDQPLCVDGAIDIPVHPEVAVKTPDKTATETTEHTERADMKTIRIIRAHLEEDAGKLMHEAPGGMAIDHSIVDLNRAGTPLLEIVTHPDFNTAQEVVLFGQVLRNICRHLGVTEGIMQKGHMRFEPNINVVIEKDGQTYKTPIVEIKNLNSFKALEGAIEYEYHRQVDEWLQTGRVMGSGEKSTRGWDDVNQVTLLQREKEDAHDYRYFPDPDLVPLIIDEAWVSQVQAKLPELPLNRQARYTKELELNLKDALALIDDPATCAFFEETIATGIDPKRSAAMLLNYGAKRANERGCQIHELGITAVQIKGIVDLTTTDKIGSSAADDLFGYCCDSTDSPESLAAQHGLLQVSDTSALEGFINEVLANPKNAKIVDDIRSGKDKAIGALLGQIMKLSQGQANPKIVSDMIKQKIQG